MVAGREDIGLFVAEDVGRGVPGPDSVDVRQEQVDAHAGERANQVDLLPPLVTRGTGVGAGSPREGRRKGLQIKSRAR